MSRKKVWAALDAANATTALANYAATQVDIAAVEADIVTANADIAALQAKSNIVSSKAANNAAAVVAHGAMPDTTKTCKVVNELGATIGYVAVYANADLSA